MPGRKNTPGMLCFLLELSPLLLPPVRVSWIGRRCWHMQLPTHDAFSLSLQCRFAPDNVCSLCRPGQGQGRGHDCIRRCWCCGIGLCFVEGEKVSGSRCSAWIIHSEPRHSHCSQDGVVVLVAAALCRCLAAICYQYAFRSMHQCWWHTEPSINDFYALWLRVHPLALCGARFSAYATPGQFSV
jgi:hypothetical protein